MVKGNRWKTWRCFLAPLLGCVIYGKHATLAKDNVERPSVAIVGAGIGGSAASHFLRELLGDDAEIVVFESAAKAGGRTDIFETGASIVYTGNEHIVNMTERFNLTRVDESKQEGPNTALWDGERFVLTTTGWGLANIVKMARRYGISLFKMNSMVHKTLAKFRRIYDLQANGRVFDTPEALWGELGLLDLTRMSIEDHFQDRVGWPNSLVENELAHAVNRVNYNQGNELNALAGLVSLCPAVTGDVFKIDGGNSRLSKELLRASASEVHFNTTVSGVSGDVKSKYSLFDEDGVDPLGTFDAVIIAVPISLAGIALDVRAEDGKAEPLRHPLPLVEFQEVHVVYVRGVINRSYFGLGPKKRMPASVLLTESAAHLAFSSLSLHSWVGDPSEGVGVYKLFSRQELWTGLLNSIFVEGSWEIWYRKKWRAYPVLTPNKAFSPALLFTGHPVWYVSSLEESVSALEISAISAKNAALGVTQALRPDYFSKGVIGSGPAEVSRGVRQEASREL